MSRITEIRSDLNKRGRSVVNYSADLVEWSAEKGLAVVGDVASFAVAQIRLPLDVDDLAEYRESVKESVSEFGETLKDHGQDYVTKIKGLPEDIRKAVNPKAKKSASKTAAKKKAARKKTAPRKKAAAKMQSQFRSFRSTSKQPE